MQPTENRSLPFLISLNTYWVGLSFMWNSLHIILLPAVLLNFVADERKNTVLGLLTFGGLIIAMLVQPISGALSDNWHSRWGRRRPLLAAGTFADLIFLALLGWAGGLPMLLIGYLGLQFTSNMAHGPAQGLLPDQVPPKQLGAASGLKNLMDMAGLVVASLLMGNLVPPDVQHPVLPVALVSGLLVVGLLVTLFVVREQPARAEKPVFDPVVLRSALDWRGFLRDLRSQPPFAWLVFSRFLFLLGIYDIQVFLQYYVRDVLAVDNPVKLTGDLMAAVTLALMALALAGGWLGDRFGHRRMQTLASLVGAVGCVLLLWARTPGTLLVFGAVLGMGVGLFLTANWALCNQLAPSEAVGKYMGLTNLATAGSGAVARLAGPLIDWGNALSPGAWLGYTGMFLFGAVVILFSSVVLVKVFSPRL